jgi:hypothetical protein
LGLGRSILSQQVLGVLDEDVTELGVPVLVRDVGGDRELTGLQSLVDLLGSSVELVQNPALRKRLVASLGNGGQGFEVVTELAENEFGSLVDLVTETTVTVDDLNIKSDVTTCKTRD